MVENSILDKECVAFMVQTFTIIYTITREFIDSLNQHSSLDWEERENYTFNVKALYCNALNMYYK